MSLAPGRNNDMAMLEDRLRDASSVREREVIRDKIGYIKREAEDEDIREMRGELVRAARAGDSEAGDRVSERIYAHQRKQGLKR